MRLDNAISGRRETAATGAHPLSFFEFWPGWLFYTPVVVHWIMLGLRYGDFSLPSAANPGITTGGLCGESKLSILDHVGPEMRHLLAPACGVPARGVAAYGVPAFGDPACGDPACGLRADPTGVEDAEAAMRATGLTYPIVAKPDIGCNGSGVRLVRDRFALIRYLAAFPAGETVVLQHYVEDPGEAGIFYVRHPDEPTGRITSLTLKQQPIVVGDGQSTLHDLILADERASLVPHLYLQRLGDRLASVPAPGERIPLVFVGNHCKGSIFENGQALITPALTEAVDRLARSMPEFHFGRIDVRFATIDALRSGTGFRVIEINGVGSEATHIWDPKTKLLDAWRTQFFHYGEAFRIGAANRRRGFASSGLRELYRDWMNQRRLMAIYPLND